MQDCSIPIANALEILQSCTKPLIYQSTFNGFYRNYMHLAAFTKEVNSRLAKHPLFFNGRLANCRVNLLSKRGHRPLAGSDDLTALDQIFSNLLSLQRLSNEFPLTKPQTNVVNVHEKTLQDIMSFRAIIHCSLVTSCSVPELGLSLVQVMNCRLFCA